MHILVVEDEKKTAAYLKKGLSENGFQVDIADNGEEGLELGRSKDYDLIILDVMLPKLDGWSVMSQLRREGKQTLSIFLTAKDAVSDRIKGLDLGADAYLVKPFSFSELMAQIRSLLRRSRARSIEVLRLGDLELDFIHHRAMRAGNQLDLTQKEFNLLSLLARRSGEILSRTLIAEQVWDMNFDSFTNVVEVQIRRLRAKVDEPFERKLIHTVRGRGYVLREESA